ncbi:hypothetical protein D3C72_1027020 [compost metagenome]
MHPGLVLRPPARPSQVIQPSARRARRHATRKLRQHIEMLACERHHLVLERIVGNHGQGLARKIEQARHGRIRRQSRVQAFDFHPFDRARQGRNERSTVGDALPLQRQRLRKNRRRIHGIDQIDCPIKGSLPITPFGHAGHQLHQPAFASVGIANQAAVALQHAFAHDGVMRAANGVQLHAKLAYGGRTRA